MAWNLPIGWSEFTDEEADGHMSTSPSAANGVVNVSVDFARDYRTYIKPLGKHERVFIGRADCMVELRSLRIGTESTIEMKESPQDTSLYFAACIC